MKTPALIKPAAITKQAKQKIGQLLKQEQITKSDFEALTKPETDYLDNTCAEILDQLQGTQLDNFLAKIDPILTPETKSDIWENNHLAITEAIADFIRSNGYMPTQNDIAILTGLSRQTVAKHLKEYKRQPEFMQQAEQFTFMAPQLLANVFKFAMKGDMRATKLYFELVGAKPGRAQNTLHRSPTDVPGPQNNYIQINNTILSQQNLANLTAEQLNQIEGIIKG